MINKNDLGTIYIEDKAIKDLVKIAVHKTKFARPLKKDYSFIKIVTVNKKIQINVSIIAKQGKDVLKICSTLQKNICDSVNDCTSANISDVNIEISDFYN